MEADGVYHPWALYCDWIITKQITKQVRDGWQTYTAVITHYILSMLKLTLTITKKKKRHDFSLY